MSSKDAFAIAAKIFIKAQTNHAEKDHKEDEEIIVDGLHESIININTFNKVQEILKSKRRIKKSSYDDILFLRGFLKCNKCGGNTNSTIPCNNIPNQTGQGVPCC